MSSFQCQTCGRSFNVPEKTLERYPNWTPKHCLSCHGGRRGSPPKKARGKMAPNPSSLPGRPETGGGSSATRERNLTLAEVLARYVDGPKTGVFTDGAAHPNPGQGGWGAVYVLDDHIVEQARGHEPSTTNNRMELKALLAGYAMIPKGRATRVMTDSRLCVSTINEWAKGWEKSGWKRKSGPIKNLDLVRELYDVARSRPEVELCWIKAHSGYRWNEYADSLATAYRRELL